MGELFEIGRDPIRFEAFESFTFKRREYSLSLTDSCLQRIEQSHKHLYALLEKKVPIYGVTTGFGDSCFRVVDRSQSEQLQKNLISYLLCGSGPSLSRPAVRATFLARLVSLTRGFSGVSGELIDRMKLYLENDWLPVIPREGSLGASGDLVPLAYVAEVLQGQGQIDLGESIVPTSEILAAAKLKPYRLKPKEGLALVNGTSAMVGLSLVNLTQASFLSELACIATSWACLALKGRKEAFGVIVNEQAKSHQGQIQVARLIRQLLEEENHRTVPAEQIGISNQHTEDWIQDRYSLRCTPQVLGPVYETLSLVRKWIETELNGVSDNPLIDQTGSLATGGNFYGGYLSQGMDFLKVSLAQIADLMDRQLMTLIDEKSNRGLPPNLANWPAMKESERYLHHGLKGVHQSVSAITSEILAKAMPNSIFSRSSESHNQDKVSLGMSAAVQCSDLLEQSFTVHSQYLVCLVQALDLRGLSLKGPQARGLYEMIREYVPFVERDSSLGSGIDRLKQKLRTLAHKSGTLLGGL